MKWNRLMASVGIASIILAGCGTAEKSASNNRSKEHSQSKQTANADQQDTSAKPEEKRDDTQQQNSMVRLMETNLQYELNGAKKENTAFLKKSGNNSYSLYVLPEYELSSEEPNRDILFLKSDDSIFMRIETLSPDFDSKMVKENMKSELASINPDVKEVQPPAEGLFQNAIGLETSKDNDVVTSYLINNKDLKVKLSIYTKKDADHKDAFTEMAKTMAAEQ
ncbi:hypothetical protein [Neobacillus terrae]|uniref:hypothetical protein n=1 Tax=Neobacillus terrae TaxID=3034837 RepID=UPI00140E7B7F|nr:hypothetical protein [Neobacillus terrae]NHM29584.1 hypothetical protein [Neobacillus terrae]